MTIYEAAEEVVPVGMTWDTALPATWVDWARKETGDEIHAFVWVYDGREYGGTGRPFALTMQANATLERLNAATGSCWPLTPNPIPEETT